MPWFRGVSYWYCFATLWEAVGFWNSQVAVCYLGTLGLSTCASVDFSTGVHVGGSGTMADWPPSVIKLGQIHLWWPSWTVVCWPKRSERLAKSKLHTNKKWKNGKWAFSGNRHLKKTQSYPIPFGLRILRLLPRLRQQVWSYKLNDAAADDAPKRFSSTLWGDQWQEASLLEVAIYLRGSIHLRASPRWKETFPVSFPLVWIRVPDQNRRCLDKNVVKIC